MTNGERCPDEGIDCAPDSDCELLRRLLKKNLLPRSRGRLGYARAITDAGDGAIIVVQVPAGDGPPEVVHVGPGRFASLTIQPEEGKSLPQRQGRVGR